jgi:hypothetical protein
MKSLLLVFGLGLSAAATFGAENLRIGPPQDTTQPSVISGTASLKLGWNETTKPFEITVSNDEARDLKVYGVQTTAGLYVADFPTSIPGKGRAAFVFIYATAPGKAAGGDLVRILTDRAEKIIEIKQEREPAVQFSATKLAWLQDEFPTAKSVTFTVAAKTTTPKAVEVVGLPGTASLESLGGGSYRVTIAPLSTAKPQPFIAAIRFEPALPGVPTFISCSVLGKN